MTTATRRPIRIAWSLLAAAVLTSAGLATAAAPSDVARLALVGVVLIGVIAAPMWVAAPMLLIATAAIPTVLLANSQGATIPSAIQPVAGQAKIMLVLLAFLAFRLLAERRGPHLPPATVVALLAVLAGFLLAALIGIARGNDFAGSTGALSRDLTYPLAVFIGLVSGTDAVRRRNVLAMYRTMAVIGIGIFATCVLYWASVKGIVHLGAPLATWFGYVANQTGSHVFDATRSTFPLVQDSPNLGAVAYVLIAAMIVGPLIANGRRKDRALVTVVVVVMIGAVLATQSRTGVISIASALVIYGWVWLRGKRLSPSLTALILAASVAGCIGGYQAIPHGRSLSANAETLQARQSLWSQAASAVYRNPLGYGYDYSVNGNFVESGATSGGTVAARQQSIHEEFLSQLVDGGIIGLLLFLIVARVMVKVSLDRELIPSAALRTSFGALLAAGGTAMLANTVTQSAACQTLIWLAFGLTVADQSPGTRTSGEDDADGIPDERETRYTRRSVRQSARRGA